MTVAELMNELSKYPPDKLVKVFDPDTCTHHDPELNETGVWHSKIDWTTKHESIVEIN